MKKLIASILAASLLFTFIPAKLNATAETSPPSAKTAEAVEVEALLRRLDEIKKMDISALNKAEKKELRQEVRETKKRLERNRSGIYLSLGAVIIIVLLLIILL